MEPTPADKALARFADEDDRREKAQVISMAEKTLQVGITGFGGAGIAQFHHFNSLENCRVTAVHDTHSHGLDRARQLGSNLFLTDDFDRFLDSGIDIVAICSPDRTHALYLTASLRAGKHTLCEKPLTDSMTGCQEILHAEKKAPGIVAAAQHQMRFQPLHRRIKREIEQGSLGRLFFMEGYYVHNLVERAWLYDDWRRTDGATPLVYSGCHIVDLMRWLSGEEVEGVMAMANHLAFPTYPDSDCNVVMLRFRSGMIGQVVVAFGAGRPQDHSIRIYGNERSVENNLLFDKNGSYSVLARPFLQIPPDRTWSLRRRLGYLRRGIKPVLMGRISEWVMRMAQSRDFPARQYPLRLYEHEYAVRASIVDFVQAIRTGRSPECTLQEAARTVAVCLAGVEAYRHQRPVAMSAYQLPEFS
jgi:predicted dehydrogenase